MNRFINKANVNIKKMRLFAFENVMQTIRE